MNNYELYDKIISATYTNLAIEAINNKGIYFNYFTTNSPTKKVFLKVAFMVANFENVKIYLNCLNLSDFLKIVFDNYSLWDILRGKCVLRHRFLPSYSGTDIGAIAVFEAKDFGTDIGIFKEIWDEYYETDNKRTRK